MTVHLSLLGNGFQFLDTNGLPLNGGKIYTYQAGSSTPITTYTDVNGLIANSNPIILGTDGRPPSEIWLTEGYYYKFVLKNSSDVTIATYDNLYGAIATIPITPASAIPTGCIVMWSGSIGSIPSGWYLCNGSNGTPDLRDRFVLGAGSSYSVNDIGGSKDAIVVSHTHTASSTSSVTDPGHSHNVDGPYGGGGNPGGSLNVDNPSGKNRATTTSSTGISVATTTSITSTGTSGTNANMPPYFALAYIMKG